VQRLDGTHTGGTATCTTPAACDYCKAEYDGLDAFNHDWQDGICSRCGTETSVVAWVDSNGDGKYSADEDGYSMLSFALSSGVSVKLYRDINDYFGGLSLKNQSVTVDLNGHVWNMDTLSLQMSENATLTITDTSADKSGKLIGGLMIQEAGNSIVLDGVTAELTFVGLYNGTLEICGSRVSGSVTISGGALDITDDAYCFDLTIQNGTSDAVTVNIPKGHTLCVGSVEVTEIAAGESATLSAPHEHNYVDGVCTVCGAEDDRVLKGDMNGDGEVNAMDSNIVKRILSGTMSPTEEQILYGDIDGDGVINGIDSNLLARIVAGTK